MVVKFHRKQIVDQMFTMGVQSVPVLLFSLSFVSLMLVVEFAFHMKLVLKQTSLVPAFSTVMMLRELGPVVTALLLASRVGAAIAAEIGSMRTTEQLDALKVLGVDTFEYLVVPRLIGGIFASVSVAVLSVFVAIFAGAYFAARDLGLEPGEFLNTMDTFVRVSDLVTCCIKAFVFGTILPLVACRAGFRCEMGSRGVGTAATTAVVHGSVAIIVADFVLTYCLYAV